MAQAAAAVALEGGGVNEAKEEQPCPIKQHPLGDQAPGLHYAKQTCVRWEGATFHLAYIPCRTHDISILWKCGNVIPACGMTFPPCLQSILQPQAVRICSEALTQ